MYINKKTFPILPTDYAYFQIHTSPFSCHKNIKQLSLLYRPIVLTTQGLCPSSGTVSSISGWVFTKFSTSSGSVVEELNLDPCTAHPPGLQTEKETGEEKVGAEEYIDTSPERGRRKEPEEFFLRLLEAVLEYLLNSSEVAV